MEEVCTLEGCNNKLGKGIKITQEGSPIGNICLECLGSAHGAKLFLRKDEKTERFKLEEMQRIENPI
jgi:hypothetical protein